MLAQILLIMAFSIIGLRFVHKKYHHSVFTEHNDVAGFIYAVVGIIYGVLLGFFVMNVWGQHQVAQLGLLRESGHLIDIAENAAGMKADGSHEVCRNCRTYAESVLNNEFLQMDGGKLDPAAAQALRDLYKSIWALNPVSEMDKLLKSEILREYNGLNDERQERMLMLQPLLTRYFQIVLLFGALITIFFSFLFGTKNRKAHILMVLLLSGLMCLVIFLIYALDLPFSGIISVSDLPFREALSALSGT